MNIDAGINFDTDNALVDLIYTSGGGFRQASEFNFNGSVTAEATVSALRVSGYGINFTGAVNLPNVVISGQNNVTWGINADNASIGGVTYGGYTASNSFYGDNNNYGALNISGGNNHDFRVYGQNGTFSSIYTRTGNANIRLNSSSNTVTDNADILDGNWHLDIVDQSQYGRLIINGTTGLSYPDWGAYPELYVNLDTNYDLQAGNEMFGIFDLVGGQDLSDGRLGVFDNYAEGDIVLTDPDNGVPLYITYQGSIVDGEVVSLDGGTDIVLYNIPEPASLGLLLIGTMILARRRSSRFSL